jgi:hypothetical protein
MGAKIAVQFELLKLKAIADRAKKLQKIFSDTKPALFFQGIKLLEPQDFLVRHC